MFERLTSLLRGGANTRTLHPTDGSVKPTVRRVLSVVYNPIVERRPGSEGQKLSQAFGWYDPHQLAAQYAQDVREATYGLLDYQVVDRLERDAFYPLVDGFTYDVETYLRCWRARSGHHQPEGVDYVALLRQFEIVERVNAGEIDDVWFFGYPWGGFYESIMCGPGAFWCNAPPLDLPRDVPKPARRFVMMGFNYEREVGCMLEDLGHQAESIMAHVYRKKQGDANFWERFTRYDKIAPGRASVGNVHFAPNSEHDYDWGNPRLVSSDCDDWLRFPNLTGERRRVDCREWGGGDMREHHLWWFRHIPHASGATDGLANNWWPYIGDPNTVG